MHPSDAADIIEHLNEVDREKLIKLNNFKINPEVYIELNEAIQSELIKYLCSRSYYANWIYSNNEISNKDDIFITNECTRNSILKYLHKEIPYNISIKNLIFKYLKKNELR